MVGFHVPVVLFVFNRPDTTKLVFECIRKLRPSKLLIVADGPREGREGEAEKCDVVRAIVDQVDWPCDLLKNLSSINLGCRVRVSSGLDWVFENVDEAIILEDDCLPDPSFFLFCQHLLDYYRNDERIMHIGGANFQQGTKRGDGSYYFSRFCHIWGWATWKRAWKHYDVSMKLFPHFRQAEYISAIIPDKGMQATLMRDFERVHNNLIDTWDFQWTHAVYSQNGLAIIPNVNLVSNVGFGTGATHTHDADNLFANTPAESLTNVVHPTFVVPDATADHYTYSVAMRSSLIQSFRNVVRLAERFIKRCTYG